jgi:hypothetical protein
LVTGRMYFSPVRFPPLVHGVVLICLCIFGPGLSGGFPHPPYVFVQYQFFNHAVMNFRGWL